MSSAAVIVTGAAGGIGQATARKLLDEGRCVVLTDRDEESLQQLMTELSATHSDACAGVPGDICSDPVLDDITEALVGRSWELVGLVNNAGVIAGQPIEKTTDEDWETVFDVNAKAPFRVIRKFLPQLKSADNASIVNISSIAGLVGFRDMPAYCASKAALVGLTRSLALDLNEHGIRINAVCPGSIDTNMPRTYLASFSGDELEEAKSRIVGRHIMKRFGTGAEVADAVSFLLSPRASFLTGVALPIDGGWSAW